MKTKIIARKLSLKQSKIVASELRKIEQECSVITPVVVVEKAASPKSPLHNFFEWDNSVAAEQYRLWQARQLIAKVYIVPSDAPDSEPVRAFVNVYSEEDNEELDGPDQGYVWTPGLDSKPNYKRQVIAYAEAQLQHWRRKFGAYKEFFGVVREIDALK
jgi:hypothetical protein